MHFAIVDIETTGLAVDTVNIHCICVLAEGMYEPDLFGPDRLVEGIAAVNRLLEQNYTLAGHNFIEYDRPILMRYGMKDPGVCYDTRTVSRAAFPGNEMFAKDTAFLKLNKDLEGAYRKGGHALEDWGYRLHEHKGEYDGGWEHYSQAMGDYCKQDVLVNWKLLARLRKEMPDEAAMLECEVHAICHRMKQTGVVFDVDAAVDFSAELVTRRAELNTELVGAFGSWLAPHGDVKTPKRTQASKKYAPGQPGYMNIREGCEYQAFKEVQFNPASTDHIAFALRRKYHWRPTQYTDTGKAQVTAEVLRDLTYAEAPLLSEYQEIKKILGYVSEGTNGWLKLVDKRGRIHGTTKPTGTVSGRASHNSPNTGNVPSRSKYGKKARALFRVGPGRVLVGADASGLQLRALAHYLARWDDRAFALQCETGDIHEYMRAATGLHLRLHQKTWTYAKLFGAGAKKLGQIAIVDHVAAVEAGLTTAPVPKATRAGALGWKTLNNLGDAIPAFSQLEEALALSAKAGFLNTLDGRRLPISSGHTAIAMLLQGFEAVVMKKAMVIAANYIDAWDAKYVLWVHDEFQVECPPEYADRVGACMVEAMREAGQYYDLRVKIDGDYKVGQTWAETH